MSIDDNPDRQARNDEPQASPLGTARALLGRVIGRVRDAIPTSRPPPALCTEPILTRTMAGLLAAQGHPDRALAIYEHLVAGSPMDPNLAQERDRLRQEVSSLEGGRTQGVVAIPIRDGSLLMSWQVDAASLGRARMVMGRSGTLSARVVVVVPDQEQVVRCEIREKTPVMGLGEWVLDDMPDGALCTASVGVLHATSFVSAAHSAVVRTGASTAGE